MYNAADLEDEDEDPLLLQEEPYIKVELDAYSLVEPEVQIKIEPEVNIVQTRKRTADKASRSEPQEHKKDVKLTQISSDIPAEEQPEPLFPLTKRMQDRIKQMKRRMLVTLKLSEDELAKRREERAEQTRNSRKKAATSEAANKPKPRETDKIVAWARIKRGMETPEQMTKRRAKNRVYKAKRREKETPEQRARRMEYQRDYSKNRKPVKFV